jgi:hypothetical protein
MLAQTISMLHESELISRTKGHRMLYKLLRDASLLTMCCCLMRNVG